MTDDRRPGAQPGNRNSRTHGLYSSSPPDPATIIPTLRQRTREAIMRNDPTELRRIARLYKRLDDRATAHALQDLARQLGSLHRPHPQNDTVNDTDTDPILAAITAGTARIAMIDDLTSPETDTLADPFDPDRQESRP